MAHDGQLVGRPGVDDVDAVAGEHEEMLAVGLHEVALVDAGDLVIGAREITRFGRSAACRPTHDIRIVHGDSPIPPRPGIVPKLIAPLCHCRVDVPRLELVEVVGLPERVGALVADEPLARGEPDPVVGPCAVEGINTSAAVDRVLPRAAPERVAAGFAVERVVAQAACERIVAGTSAERVVASPAAQCVVALAAENRIVAVTAGDRVIAGAAVEHGLDPGVAGDVDGDRIVASAAEDADGGDPRFANRADDDAVHGRPQLCGIGGIAIDENRVVGVGGIGVTGDAPGAVVLADG